MDYKNVPTFLGVIGSVSGAKVHIKLAENVASGIAIIEGKTYKVGQVGSFIRIPQGYQNLYGIISGIGADAIPEKLATTSTRQDKWIEAQLVGESIGKLFERGISQYPNVGDVVHIVAESDLRIIYGSQGDGQVSLGYLSNAESIHAKVDINKLITRHSAVLGSTGSGKSTTVSSLIRTVASSDYPNARILLLDIHGEYAAALKDIAKVYSTEDIPGITTHRLAIPYWALSSNLLIKILFGSFGEAHLSRILDKITEYKLRSIQDYPKDGSLEETLTVDSPIPFSIKSLWYELIDNELKTFNDNGNTSPSTITTPGDAETLTIPVYPPASLGTAAPFLNKSAMGIKKQLYHCRSRLKDHRYDFLLHPEDWEPELDGFAQKDLSELISDWVGHDKQVTILDFSSVPSEGLSDLIGTVLNILYEALYWGRNISAGGRERPLLVVMEEAHKYLGSESNNFALDITKKIAKEGRKYGVGCMVVSQRPSEVDETILSQCGTFFALRLSNNADRSRVKASLPDGLGGLLDMLPSLRTGEAIITGEAASLPIRCRIHMPEADKRPNSFDPSVSKKWGLARQEEDYNLLVARWRAQNSNFIPISNDGEE